jgi:PPP family 3-phenylpropionic acid transporter
MLTKKLSINRNLYAIRAYYFLWFGANGSLSPFAPLFYKAQGLTGTEIGLLSTTAALVGMLIAPIWGRQGDRSSHPRRLLKYALFGSACLTLIRGMQSYFWWIALVLIFEGLISSGIGALSNAQALAAVHGEKSGFGSIRLWGSLGWAAASPLIGWLIERTNLFVPFAGYAVMILLGLVALQFMLPEEGHLQSRAAVPHVPLGQVVRSLGSNRAVVGLFVAFFFMWATAMGRQQFESIYIVQLGGQTGTVGLLNMVGALIEPPFMLLADRYVRRWGPGRVVCLAMFLQGVAILPVVFFPRVESFFILKLLFSMAFAFLVVSYTTFLMQDAPEGQGSTVISLFEVTLRNGVSLVCAPLAGVLFDSIGVHWLYVIAMGGNLLGAAVLVFTTLPAKTRSGV